MNSPNFAARYASISDAQLIYEYGMASQLEPEALRALDAEIDRRGLDRSIAVEQHYDYDMKAPEDKVFSAISNTRMFIRYATLFVIAAVFIGVGLKYIWVALTD
jgi:hypothetical protein